MDDLEKAREIVANHLARTLKLQPCLDTPRAVTDYLVTRLIGLD